MTAYDPEVPFPSHGAASAPAKPASLPRNGYAAFFVHRRCPDQKSHSYCATSAGVRPTPARFIPLPPQCVFADPFVSFKGVDRFKKNVSNLGGLMLDVNLKVSDFETDKARLART